MDLDNNIVIWADTNVIINMAEAKIKGQKTLTTTKITREQLVYIIFLKFLKMKKI